MSKGICKAVCACDAHGDAVPSASAPSATSISFQIDTSVTVFAQDQLELKKDIDKALNVIERLFLGPARPNEAKFRPYFVQLVKLAQLGLVGDEAVPSIARQALDSMTADLIDAEGPAIKNVHLQRLAKVAVALSIPCLLAYGILRWIAGRGAGVGILKFLFIDPRQLSSFMMLWVGCFVGVVLSYGARTTKMTIESLVVLDADYLLPLTRHLFAGTLTMILGILLCLGAVELRIAGVSSDAFVGSPMIAFVVGSLFGISELLLPGAVTKRASAALGEAH